MLLKLALLFSQDTLLTLFGIGLFVGIPALVYLWLIGFRATVFGLMYGTSEHVFKKIEDHTDNPIIDGLYAAFCAVISPIGLLIYAFSRDIRVKTQCNYAIRRINIKKDVRWEKGFVDSLHVLLNTYIAVYGVEATCLFINSFFRVEVVKEDLLDAAGEGSSPDDETATALEENEVVVEDAVLPKHSVIVSRRPIPMSGHPRVTMRKKATASKKK